MDDSLPHLSLSQRARAMPVPLAQGTPWLDDLNPMQRKAAEALDGPVLMLAGAGTGKTKTLMARVAHLVRFKAVHPRNILAVTFTNKAAREMKQRLVASPFLVQEPLPWMGTFHSISAKMLRVHAELVGLKSSFTILDTDDQIRLLKQLISAANIDEKRWPARLLAGIIDGWKNRAWTPDRVPVSEAAAFGNRGTELYEQYQERLKTLNATDFGDLLLHCVTIFQTRPDVLAEYQRRFRYILVDEYQDTNVAQYLWLRLLAQAHHNICCVGDDDQSIYGWRGAEVGNILRFEKDFPGATVIRLEQNYRSTPHILAAASAVIMQNRDRLGKTLWTDVQDGEKVRLIGHWDGEEEARWIGEQAEAIQRGTAGRDPVSLDGQAILVRASHQMRAFEDRFLTIGLPYRVIGGPRFYERLEIRDAMAYFRLAVSPEDDLAFERIANTPKRGLGEKGMQDIQRFARANDLTLLQATQGLLAQDKIGGKAGREMRSFVEAVERWNWFDNNATNENLKASLRIERDNLKQLLFVREENADPSEEEKARDAKLAAVEFTLLHLTSHVALAELILEDSGYTAMWQNDKTPEAPGRLDNLKELVKALENFDNLQGFLEHVSLIMDNESGEDGEKITIMTLHAAKGLEFPVVFLPGWEEGLFPSQRSMDESGQKGLEEERRLAYVGLTRAEELCTVSFASNRRVYGQWQSQLPSRFIDELPPAHVEVLTPPGLYGGGFGAAGMASTLEDRVARADVYNSPGWARLQRNAAARPVSQPREARNTVIDITANSPYAPGARVFHEKFGYGTVTAVEGDKLSIRFDKAGEKHVVARFVTDADNVPF